MLKDILSYGLGTLVAFLLVGALVFVFIRDITQKKHSVLRNYPVIGRFRYFFEQLGEYFRQYFFSGDRDEMPFNRATRAWVYRLAKNEGGTIGFGSTYDLHTLCVGADFVNTARGFMFSLGCIQALRCHQNTCPT